MFLHAFEFAGQPTFGVPQLHVAYEWDLCLGRKPWDEVTREDVERALAGKAGDKCVDLEPEINPVYSPLRTVARNVAVVSRIAAWGRDSCASGERFGVYGGAPVIRGLWDSDPVFKSARQVGEKVLGMLGLGAGNTAVDVDLYRGEPYTDEAYDFTLEGEIERLPPSARIWVSPVRNASPGEVAPELFRSDLVRVATACASTGRRVVLWYPRTRPVAAADGSVRHEPIAYADVEHAPWLAVCRAVVRRFEGVDLVA